MEIDFQKLMSNKSDEGLQEYIKNRYKFTPDAIEAAINEMKKRGRNITDEEAIIYQEEIQQRRDENEEEFESTNRKGKAHYWWGLLGFIPLLGAFVGVVLILLGIFRYTNKTLIYIGTACVLFTIGIYSYLFYLAKNSKEITNGMATIAQIQVNELVKNIEFYKIQHGVYPIKLEDLQENENMVCIVDPILLKHSTEGKINFQYENNGDKYKLYSVGADRIDNTEDDIYPNLKIADSTRIGLIKK
jgi:hypothetical protein